MKETLWTDLSATIISNFTPCITNSRIKLSKVARPKNELLVYNRRYSFDEKSTLIHNTDTLATKALQ